MSDTLKEYLIALGFKVDDASYKKWKGAIASGAKEVAGLGAVTVSTATAIALSVEQVAREFEGLFYASQRTREGVNNLKSYSFGMKQIGVDAGQSQAAIESFAAAQRLNPGIKGFVGLAGGTGNGPVEQLTNFVEQQKKLYGESGYYVAAMNAELAGIPETVFLQIWNNLPKLRAAQSEMNRMRKEAGLSGKEFTDQSVEFANAWDHLLGTIGLGKERIASDLIGPVGRGVKTIDELVQAFNRVDVATNGWAGTLAAVGTASLTAYIAKLLVMRLLFSSVAGMTDAEAAAAKMQTGGAAAQAAAKRGLLSRLVFGTAGTLAAGATAFYYGLGLNGSTAEKADDEPLSKEYRAKNGSGALRGNSQEALRATAIAYFEKQGWSRAAATGIASNLSDESKFDPSAVGDNGAAFGIAQWHKDRQEAFKAWSGKDIRASSFDEQLAFIQHELTQGSDAGARRAGEKLRSTNDPYDAGAIFSGLYERPADAYGAAHKRGQQAANWYEAPLAPAAGAPAQTTTATINQKTDIHVVAPDPAAAGTAVASAQDRVNGDLVRNFQGVVR